MNPLSAPLNLNFEAGAPGAPPSGWTVSPSGEGTVAETMTEGYPEGARCARLVRKDKGAGYSALVEVVRADAYRGKRIRLRGTLRTASGTGRTIFYLQVNRSGSEHTSLTGQGAGAAWRRDELLTDVPNDAETLQFGLVVAGPAEGWIDTVEVQSLGEAGLGNEPARALSDRGAEASWQDMEIRLSLRENAAKVYFSVRLTCGGRLFLDHVQVTAGGGADSTPREVLTDDFETDTRALQMRVEYRACRAWKTS
jgi:hypothetical protein